MAGKEIGGYFGLEQFHNKEYYPGLVAVNTARNALIYLIKAKNIQKIYLPYFLCASVAKVCERESCDYEYYSISKDFLPIFDKELRENEFLYIVNFFGQLSQQYVQTLKQRFENIILDNVQAFFQKPVKGIDTIYSCRKFFGVPDGAYLATMTLLEEKLEVDISKDRMEHLLGRFECGASEYYEKFKENDNSFVDLPLRYMSRLTHNILGAIDYKKVQKRRNENYKVLASFLSKKNKLSLMEPQGPYCYPFYCENGMEIKKSLARKGVFIPTLWPNVLGLEGTLEKEYAENILPLPCDQRYDEIDMKHIVEELLICRK